MKTLLLAVILFAGSITAVAQAPKVEPLQLNVPVYVHTKCKIDPTPQQIEQQMTLLNTSYSATPFRFQLMGRNYTPDVQGGDTALNVYVIDFEDYGSDGLLGYARPHVAVHIDCGTVPGANKFRLFNKGYTLVHEVGHYLSLKHVNKTWKDGVCNWMDEELTDALDTGVFTQEQIGLMVVARIKQLATP